MYPTLKHLDDEHMRLYEWSGAGPGTATGIPERSKRTHAGHASYGVLALLTSLLTLSGCDRKAPGEQVGQAILNMKKEAGSLTDDARAKDGAKAGQLGENRQKQ